MSPTGTNIAQVCTSNGLGIAFLAVAVFCCGRTLRKRTMENTVVSWALILTFAGCVVAIVTHVFNGDPAPAARAACVVGQLVSHLVAVWICPLWALFVDLHVRRDEEGTKQRLKVFLAPVVVGTAMFVLNLWFPFFYRITPDNQYTRLTSGGILSVYAIAYLAYSIYVYYSWRYRHNKMRFFPIWIFIVPLYGGFILDAVSPVASLGYAFLSLAWTAVLTSLQSELAFTDTLTGLYNREYLYVINSSMRGRNGARVAGAMLDLDHFKDINDRYGHSMGDKALVEFATILTETAGNSGICLRNSGDEFLVFLSGKDIDDNSALSFRKRLNEQLDVSNANPSRPYMLRASCGMSVYDPAHETREDFLRELDQRMYEDKRSRNVGR